MLGAALGFRRKDINHHPVFQGAQKKKEDQTSLQFATMDLMLSLPKAFTKAARDEDTKLGTTSPYVTTYRPDVGEVNIAKNHLSFGVGCVGWGLPNNADPWIIFKGRESFEKLRSAHEGARPVMLDADHATTAPAALSDIPDMTIVMLKPGSGSPPVTCRFYPRTDQKAAVRSVPCKKKPAEAFEEH